MKMKVTLLGVQMVDYVSKKTGNPVKGVTLHAKYKDAQVTGEAVDSIYVSDSLDLPCIPELKPGQIVDVSYNNRGYVCDVVIQK